MEHSLTLYFGKSSNGWRIDCSCGFCIGPCPSVQAAGAEIDKHLAQVAREMLKKELAL